MGGREVGSDIGVEGAEGADRRAHPRVDASFRVHCRRIGRRGVDQDVVVIDLSMGGMRITGGELRTGDVVELTISETSPPLTLTGLVVGNSVAPAGPSSHIAFTRLAPTTLEHIGHLVDQRDG